MRLSHFTNLKPVCPRCRHTNGVDHPLVLAKVLAREEETILEGALHCPSPGCQLEYPIIDGIPLLFADIRRYISDNALHLTARSDLSDETESMLGDCLGPNTPFDITRQHLSSYTWDNYADLDASEPINDSPQPNGVSRCLHAGLELIDEQPEKPILDMGCAVGRSSFELAESTDLPVLGIDLNFSLLQTAQRVLREGKVRYPRRRIGVVYDRREYLVSFPSSDRVDFWACDATALPFTSKTFGLCAGLQLLDSVSSPHNLLTSVRDVLASNGSAILASPYDWSAGVTPMEAWIGGHSQRGSHQGSAEPLLKTLLTPGGHPQSVKGLQLKKEILQFPWHTRIHERSTMLYQTHIVVVQAIQTDD